MLQAPSLGKHWAAGTPSPPFLPQLANRKDAVSGTKGSREKSPVNWVSLPDGRSLGGTGCMGLLKDSALFSQFLGHRPPLGETGLPESPALSSGHCSNVLKNRNKHHSCNP